MKKLLVIIFVFLLLIVSISVFYSHLFFLFFVKDHQLVKLSLKESFFSQTKKEMLVEVVKTEKSIAGGLSSRPSMQTSDAKQIDGMLFFFPKKDILKFWMKDMQFNLDICWLSNMNFLACTRNASSLEGDRENKVYSSPSFANLVLETKPGELSDSDLKSKLFFKW